MLINKFCLSSFYYVSVYYCFLLFSIYYSIVCNKSIYLITIAGLQDNETEGLPISPCNRRYPGAKNKLLQENSDEKELMIKRITEIDLIVIFTKFLFYQRTAQNLDTTCSLRTLR